MRKKMIQIVLAILGVGAGYREETGWERGGERRKGMGRDRRDAWRARRNNICSILTVQELVQGGYIAFQSHRDNAVQFADSGSGFGKWEACGLADFIFGNAFGNRH